MQQRILKRGFSGRSGRRAMLRTGKNDLVPHARVRHLDVCHDERSEHALLAGWGVSYPTQHAHNVYLTMSEAMQLGGLRGDPVYRRHGAILILERIR